MGVQGRVAWVADVTARWRRIRAQGFTQFVAAWATAVVAGRGPWRAGPQQSRDARGVTAGGFVVAVSA